MSTFTVRLNRTDAQPWGFRLQGGKDFGAPLAIQKVNVGSIADQAGLIAGDNVISVNNVEVFNLRHKDAQDVIVRSGNNFDFTVQRGGSTWKPSVTPTGQVPSPVPHATTQSVQTVTKTSLAKQHQEIRSIGTGYNNAAKPFAGQTNGSGDAPMKSIVNKQYNTPVGIYSEESIAETLSAQAEVLAGGVLGVNFKKNEKIYNAANSEVLKALHDAEYDEPEQATDQTHTPASVTKHVSAPIDRPAAPTTGGLPPGQNICADCERLIVGVFVRIKDKNLHVDCFKCSTCGSNLKNQGYFNINNKLYCDIHAKLAAINSPPPGTEGYSPVPIAPNTKLGASTISAALNAHANGNGISPQPIAPQLNLNSSLSGPKPFNTVAAPVYIPTASPKSPSSYPPPSSGNNTWSAPTPISAPTFAPPKPAVTFDASVLPKPAGQNAPAPPPTPKPLHLNTITQSDKPIIRGHATDLLEQSVKDLKVNQNDNFKFEAGKIISLMLENRSHAMKPAVSDLGRQLNPSHPMHTIIDHCDNSPPPPPPPQFTPTFTVSATLCNNDELLPPPPSTPELANPKIVTTLSISPINPNGTNLETDGNWSSDDSLGPKHLQPSVTASAFPANSLNTPSNSDSFNSMVNDNNNVILRNKNAKPELTKHARDRRSYIEKDEQLTTNNEETTAIASELKDGKQPVCCCCNTKITRGPFITALGRIWCPEHFVCVNANCRRHLQDIGFVEEKGELYCEYCFEKFLAPNCNKCNNKIKGDCLNAIGKQFHPECFTCTYCGKLFGNSPFFLEEGEAYCETDWNELFTTKCFSCGFPVEAGDKWVEALSHNYHSQCFNCTMCKKNLEGQSFYAKGGRPYCKTHAR